MGRGKGRYNKDCERVRQVKKKKKGKHGSQTAIRLREKLTGEDRSEELKADCANILQNHYNACYSDFAKRSLKKNHNLNDKNYQDFMYDAYLRGDPNLQQLGEVNMDNISLVFYNYTD